MKKTVGQLIVDHDAKGLTLEDHMHEYTKSLAPDTMKLVVDCAFAARNNPNYENKDFYIQLVHFVEPIFRKPIFKAFSRFSCPTPQYNHSVFKYTRSVDDLAFLWSLPSKELYTDIIKNPRDYYHDSDKKDLAQTVWNDYTGELLKFVIQENGNKPDAIIYNSKERKCLMNKMN